MKQMAVMLFCMFLAAASWAKTNPVKEGDSTYQTDRISAATSKKQEGLLAQWTARAKRGDVNFQEILGDTYYFGTDGARQSFSTAERWYERAAAQGDAYAQWKLGGLYANGQGVRQDYMMARQWYEKAAAQGYSEAQTSLGDLYRNGQGVLQNYATAKEWFGRACDNGYQPGCDNYAKLNEHGY